jgi:hypothetical protein
MTRRREKDYIFLFMEATAGTRTLERRIAERYLVGAAAGAIAGMLVGGVLGRGVMFVLRLTSPAASGIESDDGFVIGRFTVASLSLLLLTGALGTVNGAAYVALRSSIPPAVRAPLWVCFSTAVTSAGVVHADGVDFTLLEPRWFAVASFVVLPGIATLVVVLLVERWLDVGELRGRRASALLLAALAGSLGLIVAATLCAANLLLSRAPSMLRDRLATLGRVAVPALLFAGLAFGVLRLARETSAIL